MTTTPTPDALALAREAIELHDKDRTFYETLELLDMIPALARAYEDLARERDYCRDAASGLSADLTAEGQRRDAAEAREQALREQLAQADAAQADALDAGRYTYKQLHKWKAESIARHRAARKRAEEDDHG